MRNARTKHIDPAPLDEPITRDNFFDQHENLREIQKWAEHNNVIPFTLLGAILPRIAAMIPHGVDIEGASTANVITILAGPSGSGKSRSQMLASKLVPFTDDVVSTSITTGQGMGTAYSQKSTITVEAEADESSDGKKSKPKMTRITAPVRTAHAAFFSVDEVDTLNSYIDMVGSTVRDTMRKFFSATELSNPVATMENKTQILNGTYSGGVCINSQLHNASLLLDDRAGGTSQRILCFPAQKLREPLSDDEIDTMSEAQLDEYLHYTSDRPESLDLDIPAYREIHYSPDTLEVLTPTVIKFEDKVRLMWKRFLAKQEANTNEDDSQLITLRARLAYIMSVLTGTPDKISALGWELSGVVIELNRETRSELSAHASVAKAEARAQEGIDRAQIYAAQIDESLRIKSQIVIDTENAIADYVNANPDGLTESEISRGKLSPKQREHMKEAVANLVEDGKIERIDGDKGRRKILYFPPQTDEPNVEDLFERTAA